MNDKDAMVDAAEAMAALADDGKPTVTLPRLQFEGTYFVNRGLIRYPLVAGVTWWARDEHGRPWYGLCTGERDAGAPAGVRLQRLAVECRCKDGSGYSWNSLGVCTRCGGRGWLEP